ncbi:bacteriophage tail sheath protein (partial), partial [Pectobacterium atrosepticum SCRI1043]
LAANYLHGVETIEVETGARPVKTVKSAVIGLIGTAPQGKRPNSNFLCARVTRTSANMLFSLISSLLGRRK